MKKFFGLFAVGVFLLTACHSDDDEKEVESLTPEMLAGLWVSDYAQSGTEGDVSWTRVVEDYQFSADGTGYYECYLNQLYADWQGSNSGDDDDDGNRLNNVDGNVDVNNGGGGVNEMR